MASLLGIKTAIATYFGKVVGDLTINGQDLSLVALNQVRLQAEMVHDFEFTRKLVTVEVDGAIGGSLDEAVVYGTAIPVEVKSVIDVGIFDVDGNMRAVDWNTVAEGLNTQRLDNPHGVIPRYPTDAQSLSGPLGVSRFQFSGQSIYKFPKVVGETYTVGMEVYTFTTDWTGVLTITGDPVPYANGTYYEQGAFNGKPFYVRNDGEYLVFWSSELVTWVLAPPGDDDGLPYWYSEDAELEGEYLNQGSASGAPTIDLHSVGDTTIYDPLGISDIWTTKGAQYLQWAAIVHLNYYYKEFVFRQEGNLPPPQTLADAGLEALKQWDIFKYESFRRSSR